MICVVILVLTEPRACVRILVHIRVLILLMTAYEDTYLQIYAVKYICTYTLLHICVLILLMTPDALAVEGAALTKPLTQG
jgi:hypothetical protein